MDKDIQTYLQAITRNSKLDSGTNSEISLELQSHLEDKVLELQEEGLTYDEALSRALLDLGHPDRISKGMYSVHSPGSWRDTLLATLPHLLLASLFALHLWTRYLLIAVVLVGMTFVTLRGWKTDKPKWTYSWLGYSMAAPVLSWLMALVAVGYGGWTFVTTGSLPFSFSLYVLIIAYVPFSLWIMAKVARRIVRQDWLLASLTALPFPFLTSWMLFLNGEGSLWGPHRANFHETDSDRALIFLALAVTTAVFLKLGHRLMKIGLLTVSTGILVIFTTVALPLGLGLLSVLLITTASVAFLLSPGIWHSRLRGDKYPYPQFEAGGGEAVTHWFTNAR